MFNNKKIKKLEGRMDELDRTLYRFQGELNDLENNLKESEIFKKECHYNTRLMYGSPYSLVHYSYEDEVIDGKISIKEVLEKILEELKMVLVYKKGTKSRFSLEKAKKPKKEKR